MSHLGTHAFNVDTYSSSYFLYTSPEAILSAYLRNKRKEANLATGQLAEKIGFRYEQMRAMESGKLKHVEFDIRILHKLAEFYRITFPGLMEESVAFSQVISELGIHIGYPSTSGAMPRFVDTATLCEMYENKMNKHKSRAH